MYQTNQLNKLHVSLIRITNNKRYDVYLKLQTISSELLEMILKRKNDYYCPLSDKLNDPETSAKAY